MSSHVELVVIGVFSWEKEADPEELGGQQTSSTPTFPLSKTSPNAYSNYEMKYRVLLYIIYACVDCEV
jgi:hypothetical protein